MKKYRVTVTDPESGSVVRLEGDPLQEDAAAVMLCVDTGDGIRTVGLNQGAWTEEKRRCTVIGEIMGAVENLCRGDGDEDDEGENIGLAALLSKTLEILKEHLGPKQAAALLMQGAELMAKEAVEEMEGRAWRLRRSGR